MEKANINYTVELPSADAAWHFSTDATEAGWKIDFKEADIAHIFPPGSLAAIVLGPILAGSILGLVGWFSETGMISLPKLEPLFASPHGAVTMFFASLGISLGLLITFFTAAKPLSSRRIIKTTQVIIIGKGDSKELQSLAEHYGGHLI